MDHGEPVVSFMDRHIRAGTTIKTYMQAKGANEWTHLAVTYDADSKDVQIMVNGDVTVTAKNVQPLAESLAVHRLFMGSGSYGKFIGNPIVHSRASQEMKLTRDVFHFKVRE